MSHIIIVKLEHVEKDELIASNFDSRCREKVSITSEIKQMLGNREGYLCRSAIATR